MLWNLEVEIASCFGGHEFDRTTLLTISEVESVLRDSPEMYRTVNGTLATAEDDLKGLVVTSDQAILLHSQEAYRT